MRGRGAGASRGAVIAVLAVALALRLVPAVVLGDAPGRFDSTDYHHHAVSIAGGNGYPRFNGSPTAMHPPLYPYALGAVYAVAGEHPRAARVAQAVVGTATVGLIGLLAAALWGAGVGFVALLLAALYAPLVALGGFLITEPLFLALELGALLAVLRCRDDARHRLRWAALAGALAGLAALTRSNGVVLLVPLALGAWSLRPWRSARSLAAPAVLVATALLALVPWTVRNAVVLHAFVPVSTEGGATFAGTYNDVTRHDPRHPGLWRPPWTVPRFQPLWAPLFTGHPWDEVGADRAMRSSGLRYAREHPAYVAEVAARNSLRLLHLTGESPDDLATEEYRFQAVTERAVWLFALLALAGCFTAAARRAPRFVWLTPVVLWLSLVPFGGQDRFRAAIDPFIVLLATLAVAKALAVVGRRIPLRWAPTSARA